MATGIRVVRFARFLLFPVGWRNASSAGRPHPRNNIAATRSTAPPVNAELKTNNDSSRCSPICAPASAINCLPRYVPKGGNPASPTTLTMKAAPSTRNFRPFPNSTGVDQRLRAGEEEFPRRECRDCLLGAFFKQPPRRDRVDRDTLASGSVAGRFEELPSRRRRAWVEAPEYIRH